MSERVTKNHDEAVYDTERSLALAVVRNAVVQGALPEDIVFKVVLPCLQKMVTAISENCSANLAQHFMASQIAATVVEEMASKFKQVPSTTGVVVIGTSLGDFHSLGKRIVTGCLKARTIGVTAGRVVNAHEGITGIAERKLLEAERQPKFEELQRWCDVTLNREGRVEKLEREANRLLGRQGEPPRYKSQAR
ncbi:MAG: hypothetical protein RBU21_01215 [FCB group bacterium]|jgi:hypothetical protein|nr:hypothetical protein [FCB group bacterium]